MRILSAVLVALVTCGMVHNAQAVVLLRDDFLGSSINQSVWRLPTGIGTFFGQTQIRPPSQPLIVSGGTATLLLDTHNPTALTPGDSFWGHEIQSRVSYEVGTGLSVKSRIRFLNNPPGGVVGGFFMYGLQGSIRDEIDFELLSNDIGNETILTNVFEDDNFSQGGDALNIFSPGLDLTAFTDYEIRWLPDRIEWLVDGVTVRREFDTVTDDPQEVRINPWAPSHFFGIAYDSNLQPVAGAALNEQFSMEIDFVEVARLPAGDHDADMDVDGQDFLDWQRDASSNPLSASDLSTWQSNYNPSPLATVPEPSSGLLLMFGLLLSSRRTK